VAFHVPSDDDEADDEELAEIIRDMQERAARAKGSSMPLMLDPKKILDFIDLWHKEGSVQEEAFSEEQCSEHVS
jgi:hypothetical protein